MPEVSRFYGIMIRFYYRDHPPTHFHAIYAEHEALIEIETGNVNQGFLPKKSTRTGKRMEAIGLLTSDFLRPLPSLPLPLSIAWQLFSCIRKTT